MRVLHILPTLNVCGGIENFVMNYYRHIDKTKIQFDFIVHELVDENFIEEVIRLGGKVYLFPKFKFNNISDVLHKINDFFEANSQYKIVHCHMANAAPFYFYYINKYTRHSLKILHSHQPSGADKLSHKMRNYPLLKLANKMADIRLASSEKAGKFLFGKEKFEIIPNAIDTKIFQEAIQYRDLMREKLGILDSFVIGNIGRFAPVKNHEFMLEVVSLMKRENRNVKLCFVGDGEKKEAITSLVKNRGLEKNVLILDSCRDIERYYATFDVFLLPSFYEGLGLVAIEAQYAGLHVIASQDRVPQEAKISNYLTFLPLEAGAEMWCKAIWKIADDRSRISFFSDEYNIKLQAKKLEKYYLKWCGE